jgi:hypothetical protein
MLYDGKDMNIKRISLLVLMTLTLTLSPMAPASAHELATDKDISVELHIPPDDKPVAGQPTRLRFTFESTSATFSEVSCDCKLQVVQGSRTIASVTPKRNQQLRSSMEATVNFPTGGSYTLKLSGLTGSITEETPKERFNVAYPVQVSPAVIPPSSLARYVSLGLVGLCGLTAIGVVAYYTISYFKQAKRR